MKVKRVHVIVNPASGQDRPILKTLNSVFRVNQIDWEMFLTKEQGDGIRLAKEAAAAGVDAVAVYGGDGTVREVTTGLLDTNVPILILPGGTANAMALTLGIPTDLAAAASLLSCDECETRSVDVGLMNEEAFLIGVGLGCSGRDRGHGRPCGEGPVGRSGLPGVLHPGAAQRSKPCAIG
jgi:diacylglycerol kinase (ATP)